MDADDVMDLVDEFRHGDEDEDITDEFDGEDDFLGVEAPPEIPTVDGLPDVVDYSTRGPNDFVLSGPVAEGRGHGRHFDTLGDAYKWAVDKYGKARVGVLPQQGEFRWALLIKAA